MKKRVSLLLALSLCLLALSSCSSGSSSSSDSSAATEESSSASSSEDSAESSSASEATGQTYTIGICQLVEHQALDAATEGFEAALTERLGDSVTFLEQNAQGEIANATTIVNSFVSSDVDLILANATSPLQAAAAATTEIPILGTSVTDYATALDISDWTGTTGRNISGTSDCAPLDQQEDMLLELFPDVQQVGIVYCSAEANSKYQSDVFSAELEEDGIAYKVYTLADTNDIQTIVTAAVQECDVLYIPTDNTLASNTEAVNNIALPAGVPIIAGEENICRGCGVATLSIDYYDLGYKTGEMAYDILVNGADISTMEIAYADNVTKEYNAEICQQLGITVPDDYTAISEE